MTPEQREKYWQAYARYHEDAHKGLAAKWKEAEPKLQQYESVVAASRTDQEKAVDAAKAEGARAGSAALIPQILAAKLEAASGGRITAEDAAARVAFLDKNLFLGADGLADTAKVEQWVKGQAGALPPASGKPHGFPPDMGQGPRGGNEPLTGKAAGEAMAKKRGWVADAPATQSA